MIKDALSTLLPVYPELLKLEGWSVFKFSNFRQQRNNREKIHLWVDTDFPMFRLGDIYLMYAEAVARGGEGSKASAVEYINALRKRAYGDENTIISENWLEEIISVIC